MQILPFLPLHVIFHHQVVEFPCHLNGSHPDEGMTVLVWSFSGLRPHWLGHCFCSPFCINGRAIVGTPKATAMLFAISLLFGLNCAAKRDFTVDCPSGNVM